MNSIHPHWDSTDEGAAPARDQKAFVRITDADAPSVSSISTVSRRPAALIGMLLVMTAGYVFVQGFEGITGQLTPEIAVQITNAGLVPESITVAPGDTITWTNSHALPQILESTELCSSTGECFSTTIMWENETASYTVPLDVAGGTYAYFSTTDEQLTGTIIVEGSGTGEPLPPAFEELGGAPGIEELGDEPIQEGTQTPEEYFNFLEETFGDEAALPTGENEDLLFADEELLPDLGDDALPFGEDGLESLEPIEGDDVAFELPAEDTELWGPLEETEVDIEAPLENLAILPNNPYTVTSQHLRPSAPLASVTGSPLHSGAPGKGKPPYQPNTGNGVLVATSLLSIAGLAFLTRKAFAVR